MRFGCCGSLVASAPDRTGVEIVERLAEYGYDYIELPLAEMMELDGGAFGALRSRVERSSLRCEACNNFFPARVRLTGPEADPGAARDYCVRALDRAAELGAAAAQGGSLAAFEKACDDAVTAVAARAKSVPFGVEAVISYVAAKEIEFTAVRVIMSSRLAGIEGDTIRERLREAYV